MGQPQALKQVADTRLRAEETLRRVRGVVASLEDVIARTVPGTQANLLDPDDPFWTQPVEEEATPAGTDDSVAAAVEVLPPSTGAAADAQRRPASSLLALLSGDDAGAGPAEAGAVQQSSASLPAEAVQSRAPDARSGDGDGVSSASASAPGGFEADAAPPAYAESAAEGSERASDAGGAGGHALDDALVASDANHQRDVPASLPDVLADRDDPAAPHADQRPQGRVTRGDGDSGSGSGDDAAGAGTRVDAGDLPLAVRRALAKGDVSGLWEHAEGLPMPNDRVHQRMRRGLGDAPQRELQSHALSDWDAGAADERQDSDADAGRQLRL